jgi:hypothetical protein
VFAQALAVTLGAPVLPEQVLVLPSLDPDDVQDEDVRFQVNGAALADPAPTAATLTQTAITVRLIVIALSVGV